MADEHPLFSELMVNLTPCWPLLTAALGDLTLIFPNPLACFHQPKLHTFHFPKKMGQILRNTRHTIRKCISKNLTFIPTACFLPFRRTPQTNFPTPESKSGARCLVLLKFLRTTPLRDISESFLNSLAFDPRISRKSPSNSPRKSSPMEGTASSFTMNFIHFQRI